MLITETLAEKWYRTDSWVYKNFAYLYQNKLWNRKISDGYSLCPYFWLSLFSLFVIRPFVCVGYILKVILTAIFGKWFSPIDKTVCKFGTLLICSFEYKTHPYDETNNYVAIGPSLITFILVSFWSFIAYWLYVFDTSKLLPVMQHAMAYSATVFFSLFTIATIMKLVGGYTHNASLFKKSRTLYNFIPKLFGVWGIITGVFIVIVNHTAILKLLLFVLTEIGHFIKDVWLIAYTYTIAALMYNGLGIPLWILLVGVAGVAWISSYGFVYIADKYDMDYTPAEKKAMEIEKWIDTLVDIYSFKTTETIDDIHHIVNSFGIYNRYSKLAAEKLSRVIIKNAVHAAYYALLAEVGLLDNPRLVDGLWKGAIDTRLSVLRGTHIGMEDRIRIGNYKFQEQLTQAVDKQRDEIIRLAKKLQAIDEENKHRYDWMLSNPIYIKLALIKNTVVAISNKIKRTVIAGWEQVTIFLSYMKMLVIAKKQKACPYFMFKAPVKPLIYNHITPVIKDVKPVSTITTEPIVDKVVEPIKVKKLRKPRTVKVKRVVIKRKSKKKKK